MDSPADGMHLDGDALCDYAEDLMEGPARARAEIHLRGCAAYRKEIDAMRGYFLEMESLEPAKAPADFLAKVHARLPRPSPWNRALSALSRPWRAIPVQIAFLTLLGVTGITAYLMQRGGLESEVLPISAFQEAEPAGEAPGGEASPPVATASPAQIDEDGSRQVSTLSKAAKPRSAPEALSKRAPGPDAEENSDRAGSAGVSDPGAEMLADYAPPMEIRIRMAAMADSAAMLAGLRAMGTETSRQGSQSPEYILSMPTSRLAETRVYLGRYGTLQGADRMEPGSESSRIRILLRLLPPNP